MAEAKTQLDLPLLLPKIADERDRCVERLRSQAAGIRGIHKVHVERHDGKGVLCLHYDPNLISLARVQRLATQAGAKITARYRHQTLHVGDMDCPDCARSIEHILRRQRGIIEVSVNYAAEKIWLEYDTERVSSKSIAHQVRTLGYTITTEQESPGFLAAHGELALSLLAGLLLLAGLAGEKLFGMPLALALYALAYLAGGYNALRHGFAAARRLRFDVDLLMIAAAAGAAILGEWAEGALLLFLFSLGHALEHFAMRRARTAIQALGDITPKTARLQREGSERVLPVDELLRGDLVIVRPGERLPIDGMVRAGASSVDQSPITGESLPVEKGSGDPVYAGSLNGSGTLEIEVTKLARDTTLARVVQMVEEAQAQKSPTQMFTERFTRLFVPSVLVATFLVIVVPPLAGLLPWQESFLRGMTILVAASPCALAIATPSAVLAAIAQAARNGVLIKGGVHLENLGRLQAIAFDKTGTITLGKPEVTDIPGAGSGYKVEGEELATLDLQAETVLRLAAAVESRSTHPLARAILRKAQEAGLRDLPRVTEVQSLAGLGLQARLNGRLVRIGSHKLFADENDPPLPAEILTAIEALEASGKTTMLVHDGERFLGLIALADRPRPAARRVFDRLKKLGIKAFIMLTGDNHRVANAVARQVGLTDFQANLLPDEKVTAVKALLARHRRVAMIGDGVNDAPALATATVGIAMGASGSDVALETADVALMGDDLSKLPFLIGLSRQSTRIIRQNLVISLGVIAVLVVAAVFGLAGIGIAIVFHEGSTLLVVANALRLLGYRNFDNLDR